MVIEKILPPSYQKILPPSQVVKKFDPGFGKFKVPLGGRG